MNSQEEEQVLRSQPQGGLESPFLAGEFFEQESEEEWKPRISALVSESPFQRAFGQGQISAIEPEELESFDEEAYFAAEIDDQNGENDAWDRNTSEEELYFEHDQPAQARVPQPTVAADLAIMPFAPALKSKRFSLLPPNKNKAALVWNAAQHPAKSGVEPQLILDKLKDYVDLPVIEHAINQFNAANPATPIDLNGNVVNSVFVEAIHQFQQKCFTDKGLHDGKAGARVLHSLGIIEPKGKNPLADVNLSSKAKIKDKGIHGQIGSTIINHRNWFDFIVNPAVFGWTTDKDPGIHYELAKKLRIAENLLLAMPTFKNLSPAELGEKLGIKEVHKGYRRTKTNNSYHNFGLGIDISYDANPFVRGADILEVIKDAALLHGRSVADFVGAGYAQKYLFSLSRKYSTDQIYDILHQHHKDFVNYLSYTNNLTKIKELLGSSSASAGLLNAGETLDAAAARWQRKIQQHWNDMEGDKGKITFERNNRTRRRSWKGFLSLRKELVVTLRDKACLAWGAVDFGNSSGDSSGDIMHFDMRSIDPFSKINNSATFHPCRTGNAGKITSRSNDGEVETEHFGLLQFDTPTQTTQQVGWHDASPNGQSNIVTPPPGSAGWNQDKLMVGDVLRIPLEGLMSGYRQNNNLPDWTAEAANGKAIVLIPKALDVMKLEVLLYFHGDGPGYRQAKHNFCIHPNHKGCLAKGWVEDVETARIAQQLQASARPIMAVLPQCPNGSRGRWPANCDDYLREIFDRLVKVGIWKQKPSNPRVILAGHSRGGDTIFSMISSDKKLLPSNLAQLVLFDGIHGSSFQEWALRRLSADLKKIQGLTSLKDQLDYLHTSIKFRAYHAGISYTNVHDALEKAIKFWFVSNQKKLPSISTTTWDTLRAHYQVISAGHEDHFLVGKPMLGALSDPPLLNALKSLPVVKAGATQPPSTPTPSRRPNSSPEAEWEAHLAELEADSPFSHAFEQGRDQIYVPELDETEAFDQETYSDTETDDDSGEREEWNHNSLDEEAHFEYDDPGSSTAGGSVASASAYKNSIFTVESADARLRDDDLSPKQYTAGDTLPSGKKKGDYVTLPRGAQVKISSMKTDRARKVFALVHDPATGSAALPLGWTSSENFRGKLHNQTLGVEPASYIVEPAVRTDFFTVGNHEARIRKGNPGYAPDKTRGKLTQGSFVAVVQASKDTTPEGKYVKVMSLKKSGDAFVTDKDLGWTAKNNLVPGLADFKGSNAAWESTGKGMPGDYLKQIDLLAIVANKGKQEKIARDVYPAYIQMVQAAAAAGIELILEDGFRSYSDQVDLYKLYKQGKGNLAAGPGRSNHQNGIAFDLVVQHTSNKGVGTGDVYNWLKKNATSYGFVRTVPKEAWHWEYRPPLADQLKKQGKYKSWDASNRENEDFSDESFGDDPDGELDFADEYEFEGDEFEDDTETSFEDFEDIDYEYSEEAE